MSGWKTIVDFYQMTTAIALGFTKSDHFDKNIYKFAWNAILLTTWLDPITAAA